MGAVEAVDGVVVGSGRLGGPDQLAVPIQVLGEAGHEGDQPVACRRAGAERRLAPDQLLLEKPLALADHRPRQAGAIAEAAEERALADARLRRDVVHRHVLHPALREEALARVEDARRVAGRVGTRGGKGLDARAARSAHAGTASGG